MHGHDKILFFFAASQKAHWAEGGHKNQCKELSRASHEWFPYPEEISHLVKRTGLDRPAVLKLLQEYKNKKGSGFPATFANGIEAENFAMSVWVYDVKTQLKGLDDSLGPLGIKSVPSPPPPSSSSSSSSSSSWTSWISWNRDKNDTLEALHEQWTKGGRTKAAPHENFFDTEFMASELKVMRQVRARCSACYIS
jgi:hypothetical protein